MTARPSLRPRPTKAQTVRAEAIWVAPTAVLHAETIAPSLSEREWVLPENADEPRAHAFLILSRRGILRGSEEEMELPSPFLLWLPSHGGKTVRIDAGARGYMLSVDDDFLTRTVSSAPEGSLLRPVMSRFVLLPPQRLQERADEIAHSFQALAREVRSPDRVSMTILGAHLTVIGLHIWRLAQSDAPVEAGLRGTGHHVLQQFRQLVELRYREHWSVGRYAAALGVTEDRLHAVCVRNAGHPPRALVCDRVVQDACMRLQQMDVPIEQIAFGLGFKDPGYFNRFFKKHVGIPPGVYRRRVKAQRAGSTGSYAAWP